MLKEGIHSIPFDQYLADPCVEPSLSSHIAQIIVNHSPLHAKTAHPRLNPKLEPYESTRLDFGSATHDILLEGGTPKVAVFDPDQYPNAKGGGVATGWTNKAIREARAQARDQGKIPILLDDWRVVQRMVETAKEFIATTEVRDCLSWPAEQTIIWRERFGASKEDPLNQGIWCRARTDLVCPDWSTRPLIMDYKSTTDANPEYLARRVLEQMGYTTQAAFYTRGTQTLWGGEPTFLFLFQEIDPPYACSLIGLEPALLAVGASKVAYAMQRWHECTRSGNWPGYSSMIHFAQAPAWALSALENYEAQNEANRR